MDLLDHLDRLHSEPTQVAKEMEIRMGRSIAAGRAAAETTGQLRSSHPRSKPRLGLPDTHLGLAPVLHRDLN